MGTISFQDSVTGRALPPTQLYGVYYANGAFANYDAVRARLSGKADLLGITVSARYGASIKVPIADCETGDFTVPQVIAWVQEMIRLGAPLIVVYANRDTWSNQGLQRALAFYGDRIRRWVAQYDGIATVPPGFDGKQYLGNVNGGFGNVDKNIVLPDFFTPWEKAKVKPEVTDPNHYGWFTSWELPIVKLYDQYRALQGVNSHPYRPQLAALRLILKAFAGQVYAVSKAHRIGGHPTWGLYHRGWRFQQLSNRANGQRLV